MINFTALHKNERMYIRKKTFEKNLFLQDSINIGTNKNNLLLIQNAK